MSKIFLFSLASLALIVTPGPDLLFTITTSVVYGWRKGMAVACGLCTGVLVDTLLVAFGVAALLTLHPAVTTGLRVFGVCYLLYVAFTMFRTGLLEARAMRQAELTVDVENKPLKLFMRGIIMSLSNPLTTVFFLSFLPNFVDKDAALVPAVQMILLGALFVAIVPFVYFPAALGAGKLGELFARHPALRPRIKQGAGIVIALIALRLALTHA